MTTRLAVLGSPIAHSKSPALHEAAYGVLGLPWQYETVEVDTETLPGFIGGLTPDWRGLSLTMPLKREVLPLLGGAEELVQLTGVANTVLVHDGLHGFNTDIYGIAQAFREAGAAVLSNVRLLGGGATAASAIVAMAQLGGARVIISVREPRKAERLVLLGEKMGLVVEVERLGEMDAGFAADAVISTLPGGADPGIEWDPGLIASSVLLDVAYEPWPSQLATVWSSAGGRVIPGIEMLVNQALVQVRIFVGGDPDLALPDEERVLAAMRAAVGLAPRG